MRRPWNQSPAPLSPILLERSQWHIAGWFERLEQRLRFLEKICRKGEYRDPELHRYFIEARQQDLAVLTKLGRIPYRKAVRIVTMFLLVPMLLVAGCVKLPRATEALGPDIDAVEAHLSWESRIRGESRSVVESWSSDSYHRWVLSGRDTRTLAEVRRAMLEHRRKFPACAWCRTRETIEVHHLLPVSRAPEAAAYSTNLVSLCRRHHWEIGHLGVSWSAYCTNLMDRIGKRGRR